MGSANADLNLVPPLPDSNTQSELTLSKPSFHSERWEVLTSASPPNHETQMISCVHMAGCSRYPGNPRSIVESPSHFVRSWDLLLT